MVHWPLMGGLLHLHVQREGAPWAGWCPGAPPSPLIVVLNVTAHPWTASVPTSYYLMWHYILPLDSKGLHSTIMCRPTREWSRSAYSLIWYAVSSAYQTVTLLADNKLDSWSIAVGWNLCDTLQLSTSLPSLHTRPARRSLHQSHVAPSHVTQYGVDANSRMTLYEVNTLHLMKYSMRFLDILLLFLHESDECVSPTATIGPTFISDPSLLHFMQL